MVPRLPVFFRTLWRMMLSNQANLHHRGQEDRNQTPPSWHRFCGAASPLGFRKRCINSFTVCHYLGNCPSLVRERWSGCDGDSKFGGRWSCPVIEWGSYSDPLSKALQLYQHSLLEWCFNFHRACSDFLMLSRGPSTDHVSPTRFGADKS